MVEYSAERISEELHTKQAFRKKMAAAREAMEAAGADFSEIDDFIATAPLDDVKSFNSLVTNFGRKIDGTLLLIIVVNLVV